MVLRPETSPLLGFMTPSCPLPALGPSTMPKMTEVEMNLFQYYTHGICSMCALFDRNDNTYREVIVSLTQHSPLLLRAVLALSANQLKHRNPNYLTVALNYRGSVIASLLHALGSQRPHSLSKTEIVATVMILCFYDLPDDRQGDWRKHFHGARQIVELPPTGRAQSSTDGALLSFLGQYFAPRIVLAFTALDNPENEAILATAGAFWLNKIDRPQQEINCFSACSGELLEIIFAITRRWRGLQRGDPCGKVEKKLWKEDTEQRLRTLEQVPSSSALRAMSPVLEDEKKAHSLAKRTAETYRLGAIILLQYFEDDFWQRSSTIKACVKSILDLMEVIACPGESAKTCSVWPFFIAACHVTADKDRMHVLQKFRYLMVEDWYGETTTVVQSVVEKTWKNHDLNDHNTDKSTAVKGFYPWEQSLMSLGVDFTWT